MSSQKIATGICQDRRCDKLGNPSRKVWYCTACRSCLCDDCWDYSPIHSAPGAPRHEKLAYLQYLRCKRLEQILDPPRNQNELEKLHDQDTNTTWFGIDRYDDGRPFLQDFETFSHLMANSPGADLVKYPQLVSFVGETSAGKSTLVKMLIDHEESKNDPNAASSFPSPVTGSPINDTTPTSADVHLYSDPATWGNERPMLYADCEGLNAGERVPMGAHCKRIVKGDNSRRLGLRVRPLEWANSDETKTRQYAVTQTYPRLLYTFSDVVVFVLRNPKTFEHAVLTKLFEWAFASLEASTNQGTLPHAVIAINFTDVRVDSGSWNVQYATNALLHANKHVLESVTGVPKLQKLADKWRRKNKRIHSILDLIHCYYASFQVVRIPDDKNLFLLSKQVSQLHTTIADRCEKAYLSKKRARLLSSAEDFSFYIQQAFNHFSRKLDRPFDFKVYSLRRNPIPQNLGDYILRVAIAIQESSPHETGQWIFEKLSFMVASCFLYDCTTFRKGQPQDLFGDYLPNFENALIEFCSMHWPCEFSNKKGRCVNVSKRHDTKGHQNAKGKIIAAGKYQSEFTADKYKVVWMNSLKTRLAELQEDLKRVEEAGEELEDPLISIRKQHTENIARFFLDVGGASHFSSHATCLCCLMKSPEHALRCGHVLCSNCIKSFGVVKKTTIEMPFCPLHPFETMWAQPWKIRMKPDFAGVRILSLDGGGIRGIVELEVLNQIQRNLGVDIPIRAFFDLIVGTSTGGIIALALGVKQWPVGKCIEQFKRLCDQAFTPREFHDIWGLQHLATAHHGSIWETTPLYQALLESLGDSYLFGGCQDSDASYAARVAVTTTDEIASKGVIIANYCRKGGQRNYEFLRPHDPYFEMKMWEAGAATAAAAPYFKPFVHPRTNATYLDGAFFNNNPVRVGHLERRLLWPDVQNQPPDLFLSIGTSQDQKQVDKELKIKELPKHELSSSNSNPANLKASSRWRSFAGLWQVGKAAFNRFEDVINSERQWSEFMEVAIQQNNSREEGSRYIRINPDIGRQPPPLDAKGEVEKLQSDISRTMVSHESQCKVEEVVFRLVASSFYFDKGKATRNRTGGTATVSGKFQCRFEESSEWLKQLGRFFRKQQRIDFQPYFDIWNGLPQHAKQKVSLTEAVIERMASHGEFNIGETNIMSTADCKTDIRLYFFGPSSNGVQGYSISGFPRDFLSEDQWITRNSDGNEEEQESDEQIHGLSRSRTSRRITTTHDQEQSDKWRLSQLGKKLSISHIRSVSDQNVSTQFHGLSSENRRKSDEVVPKSSARASVLKRPSSMREARHHRKIDTQSRTSNDSSEILPAPLGNRSRRKTPSIIVSPTDVGYQRPSLSRSSHVSTTAPTLGDSSVNPDPYPQFPDSTHTHTSQYGGNSESKTLGSSLGPEVVENTPSINRSDFSRSSSSASRYRSTGLRAGQGSWSPSTNPSQQPTTRPYSFNLDPTPTTNEEASYKAVPPSSYESYYSPASANPPPSTAPRYTDQYSSFQIPPPQNPSQQPAPTFRGTPIPHTNPFQPHPSSFPSTSRVNDSVSRSSSSSGRLTPHALNSDERFEMELELAKKASLADLGRY
ncbi:uncharacterized protein BDR25DRAFT_280671 [Lindgomyces ingoldianus]|uniref:Uncharacterized protein n=1 Tax=Lindgomyces ingoldianus TaxID=673940 RepID=A0ACB6R9L6_9PLEO|nr:uncharacterized protein BDR25DRAFT_280671 [Lindgomyces ingoldianus]KAF2475025.1 hypothetical protein BDR25DRAFT_280671 [Lindgomyces ingoldianus]